MSSSPCWRRRRCAPSPMRPNARRRTRRLPLGYGQRGGDEGPAAGLRAGVEPHDAPGAARRSGRDLSSDSVPVAPDHVVERVLKTAAIFGDEVPGASGIRPLRRRRHRLRPAPRPLHLAGAAGGDHRAVRGRGLPGVQPASLHAGGGRHEADRRAATRLQARGRSEGACSTPARWWRSRIPISTSPPARTGSSPVSPTPRRRKRRRSEPMRVLVLFAHPVETSFGAAIHAKVVETLRTGRARGRRSRPQRRGLPARC